MGSCWTGLQCLLVVRLQNRFSGTWARRTSQPIAVTPRHISGFSWHLHAWISKLKIWRAFHSHWNWFDGWCPHHCFMGKSLAIAEHKQVQKVNQMECLSILWKFGGNHSAGWKGKDLSNSSICCGPEAEELSPACFPLINTWTFILFIACAMNIFAFSKDNKKCFLTHSSQLSRNTRLTLRNVTGKK